MLDIASIWTNVVSGMFQKHVKMQDVWKMDVREDTQNDVGSTF